MEPTASSTARIGAEGAVVSGDGTDGVAAARADVRAHEWCWAECGETDADIDRLVLEVQAALPCLHQLWCLIGRSCTEDHGAVTWHTDGLPCLTCTARAGLRKTETVR